MFDLILKNNDNFSYIYDYVFFKIIFENVVQLFIFYNKDDIFVKCK